MTALTTRPPLTADEEKRVRDAVISIETAIDIGHVATAVALAAHYNREALVTAEIAAQAGDVWRAHAESGVATACDTPTPVDVPWVPQRAERQVEEPDRWWEVA